jgi:hypothetical protein
LACGATSAKAEAAPPLAEGHSICTSLPRIAAAASGPSGVAGRDGPREPPREPGREVGRLEGQDVPWEPGCEPPPLVAPVPPCDWLRERRPVRYKLLFAFAGASTGSAAAAATETASAPAAAREASEAAGAGASIGSASLGAMVDKVISEDPSQLASAPIPLAASEAAPETGAGVGLNSNNRFGLSSGKGESSSPAEGAMSFDTTA